MPKKVFVICPVRGAPGDDDREVTQTEIEQYVREMENEGAVVHWPAKDTEQVDPSGGLKICRDNIAAIRAADEVHIWWDYNSQGSKFDLGVAMALDKPIRLINDVEVPDSPKSFEHVVVALDAMRGE